MWSNTEPVLYFQGGDFLEKRNEENLLFPSLLLLRVRLQVHLLEVKQQIVGAQVNLVSRLCNGLCDLSCSFNLSQSYESLIVCNCLSDKLSTFSFSLHKESKDLCFRPIHIISCHWICNKDQQCYT